MGPIPTQRDPYDTWENEIRTAPPAFPGWGEDQGVWI